MAKPNDPSGSDSLQAGLSETGSSKAGSPTEGSSKTGSSKAGSSKAGASTTGAGTVGPSGGRPSKAGPRADRIRVTGIFGAIAAALVVVAFFLPWVHVPQAHAERYRQRLEERLQRPLQPVPPGVPVQDWMRLATLADDQGYASGLDIFYWARTAKVTADAYAIPGDDADAPEGVDATETATPRASEAAVVPPGAVDEEAGAGTAAGEADAEATREGEAAPGSSTRALLLAAIVLASMPVVGFLLAIYFVLLTLRRAHSPALIFAVLLGAVSMGVPAAYGILREGIGVTTSPGIGLTLTGIGGGVLLLAGVFGCRLANWYRVFLGASILGGGLALIAWSYLRHGVAP